MLGFLQNEVSEDQAVTATAVSESAIDRHAPGFRRGAQDGLYLHARVTEAFNNLTDLTVSLSEGATSALGTDVEQSALDAVVLASLAVGYEFEPIKVPNGVSLQYLGAKYTVNGTAPTTGKITAWFTDHTDEATVTGEIS